MHTEILVSCPSPQLCGVVNFNEKKNEVANGGREGDKDLVDHCDGEELEVEEFLNILESRLMSGARHNSEADPEVEKGQLPLPLFSRWVWHIQ